MNKTIKRLIIFFTRKRLGIGKYDIFQFENQKNKKEYYFFTEDKLYKDTPYGKTESKCSFNWLLSNECKVKVLM